MVKNRGRKKSNSMGGGAREEESPVRCRKSSKGLDWVKDERDFGHLGGGGGFLAGAPADQH